MKRYLIIIFAIIMSLIVLTACSDSGADSAAYVSSDDSDSSSAQDSDLPLEGFDLFDVGNFTLMLPPGWKAFPQSDLFGEKDAEGNYPVDPSVIYVSREAEDEWDLFNSPYLNIRFDSAETSVLSSRDWYEDTADFDMTIQDISCDTAFSGMQTIVEGYKDEYLHIIFDKGQFTITYTIEKDGEPTGLSHDDPEVVSIFESLKIK